MESSLSSVIEVTRPRLLGEGAVTPLATMKNRLPLVVGVTGLRSWTRTTRRRKDGGGAEVRGQRLLQEAPAQMPAHTDSPDVPMAKGADQLVAAVLELRDDPDQPLDVELLVPLPMPRKSTSRTSRGMSMRRPSPSCTA